MIEGGSRAVQGLLTTVILLALMGVVAGVSAAPPGQGWSTLAMHAIHLTLGAAAFLFAYTLPADGPRRAVPGILVLLFLVLMGMLLSDKFGHSSHAAERWIRIGEFTLQPSVFLQCFWPLALASWSAKDPLRLTQPRELTRLMLVFACLVSPVLLQPDLGSVIILLGITTFTLLFAGVSIQLLKPIVFLSFLALGFGLLFFPHVDSRITQFLSGGPGFQVQRENEAFAFGGFSGLGPGRGMMKNGWVPEGDTDFILALIAEEWGILGTGFIWILFVALTLFGVMAARRAERRYGALLMAAATLVISVQAVLNMAVVTGIAPPKGLPLPFVSRGGTSMLALAALLGFAVKAAREARRSKVPVENLISWTESNAPG
jgi:cell division protein FtsW